MLKGFRIRNFGCLVDVSMTPLTAVTVIVASDTGIGRTTLLKALGAAPDRRRTSDVCVELNFDCIEPQAVPLPFCLNRDALVLPSDSDALPVLAPDGGNLPRVVQYMRDEMADHFQLLTALLRHWWAPFEAFVLQEMNGKIHLAVKQVHELEPSPSELQPESFFRLVAVGCILFGPGPPLALIDDIDLHFYPGALRLLAEQCRHASFTRQLIVTAANTAFVNGFKPDEVWVLGKHDGDVVACRAADVSAAKLLHARGFRMGDVWSIGALNAARPSPDVACARPNGGYCVRCGCNRARPAEDLCGVCLKELATPAPESVRGAHWLRFGNFVLHVPPIRRVRSGRWRVDGRTYRTLHLAAWSCFQDPRNIELDGGRPSAWPQLRRQELPAAREQASLDQSTRLWEKMLDPRDYKRLGIPVDQPILVAYSGYSGADDVVVLSVYAAANGDFLGTIYR